MCSLKDGFGFIRCVDREARMFFHFSELMTPERDCQINDEVQFTIVQVSVHVFSPTASCNCCSYNRIEILSLMRTETSYVCCVVMFGAGSDVTIATDRCANLLPAQGHD